jgi:HSP20 family protein
MATNDQSGRDQGRQQHDQSQGSSSQGAGRQYGGSSPGASQPSAYQQPGSSQQGGAQQAITGQSGTGAQRGGWAGDRQRSGSGQESALARRGSQGLATGSPYGYFGGGPFSIMRRMSDEMDRLFESIGFGGAGADPTGSSRGALTGGTSMWSPHVEVYEKGDKLVITADLPGVKKDDVNVEIDNDQIVLQGERKEERSSNERGFYRSERTYGSFYRVLALPEGVNAENANATFRDGVLTIELDVPRRVSARKLEIRDSSGAWGSTTGASGGSQSSGATGTGSNAAAGSQGESKTQS